MLAMDSATDDECMELNAGTPVTFTLDDASGRTFTGTVESVSASGNVIMVLRADGSRNAVSVSDVFVS